MEKRPVVLRRATADEVEELSELALRSKAHWGYDDDFIDACREELAVRAQDVLSHRLTVAVDETRNRIVGFYGLSGTTSDDAELCALFVEPGAIGTGVGRILFDDARRVAGQEGFARFRIEADPFAAAFYEHVGAIRAGNVASQSIEGRVLPLYVMDVGRSGPGSSR